MGPATDLRGPEPSGLLIVAYGNDLMGDDGAAHALAQAISESLPHRVRLIAGHQLTPELSDEMSKVAHVVFVDARAPDHSPDAVLSPLTGNALRPVGHAFDPASLMELTRTVFGRSPQAWLLTLPTDAMEIGEGLSDVARRGVEHGMALLREHMRVLGYTA